MAGILEFTPDETQADLETRYWQTAPRMSRALAPLTADGLDDEAFRLLADHLPTLCWIANGDGYIVWYNSRWHAYCGTTPEEMEGWGWTSVHDPDTLPDVVERWTGSIKEGAPFEMTFPLRGADGVFRPFLTRIVPVRDATGAVVRWLGTNTKISDQVRAEARAARSEATLRAVLEQMPVGVSAAVVPEGSFLFLNKTGVDMLGTDHAPKDLDDYAQFGAVDEQGLPYDIAKYPLARAAAKGERVEREPMIYHRPDGRVVNLEVSASRVLGEEGEPLLAVCTFADVTERLRSVEELREAGERYRLAARATNDAIWDWRMADGHVVWNAALRTLFGHEKSDTAAQWWLEQIHPDDRVRVEGDIHAVIDGRDTAWLAEYRFRRADGGYADVLDRGYVLRDGDGRAVRMIGAMQDLTERRARDEALRSSEARFRAFAEALPGILFTTDAQGGCDYVNPYFETFTGKPRDELTGAGWTGQLHPDDLDATMGAWEAARTSGQPFEQEFRIRRDDGAYRWFLTRSVPARGGEDGAGPIRRWIGSCVEIQDIVEARQLKERQRAELELLVAARTRELEEAQEALRQAQKMEAVGQLTGGIAHDFNNLLQVVTGNLDMARRRLGSETDPRVQRGLDSAMKGAERAASLTQRLLAFSRRQPLDPKPLDVNKLVVGMSDLVHRALGETIRLEVVTSPGLWTVEADPNQLESAILNLAVNARDAMPGGGTLIIETANARLDDAYAAAHAEVAPGPYVVIAVTDNGAGMSRETIARVFEPFFTTKEVGKGTGLGLSQVYGFSKQSGDHVKVYSEEGLGTTVKIYLPRLLHGQVADDAEAQAGPSPDPAAHRILVVKDDDDVRAYSVECLRELCYDVLEAPDGATALALLEKEARPSTRTCPCCSHPGNMPRS